MPAIVHPLRVRDRSCLGIGRFLIFLPLLACTRVANTVAPDEVQITPVGCAIRHVDGRCELQKSGFLRLHVRSSRPFERVSIHQGQRELLSEALGPTSDRERVFRVQATPDVNGLTVRVQFAGGGNIARIVSVRALQNPHWLRQADDAWLNNRDKEATDLLQRAFDDPSRMTSRDHALGQLLRGRMLALERSAWERAAKLLEQAHDECHRIGIVSCQIDAALARSRVSIKQHRLPTAEQLLRSLTGALERMPEMGSWVHLQDALIAQHRGDFRSALRRADEAIETATRYQDGEALSEGHALMAELLARLGPYDRVRDHLQQSWLALALAGLEQPEPCRPIYRSLTEARWLMDIRSEMDWQPDKTRWRLGSTGDPRPLLDESLKRAKPQCSQEDLLARIMLLRARAELLDRRWDEAQRWLDEARRTEKDLSAAHMLEWTELSGQLALGRGAQDLALAAFRQMLELTNHQDSEGNWFEPRWRAWVGIGQTLETTNREGALAAYAEAERTLDAWVRFLPFGEGRTGFLGGHALGTGRYIELLVRQRQFAEALAVSRWAALRGHREYAHARALSDLSPEAHRAWEQALAAYRKADIEWSKAAAQLSLKTVPQEQQRELEKRQPSLNRKLWELTDQLLQPLNGLDDESLPKLQPGEVLLVCHPVPQYWLCLAADRQQVKDVWLDRLDPSVPQDRLAKQLIQPIAHLLRPAHRLRVVSGEALDRIDLHRLPFPGGGTLGDHLAIVHTLDLPRRVAAAAASDQTLLLVNPQRLDNFAREARMLEIDLAAAMRRHHEVSIFPVAVTRRGVWSEQKPLPRKDPAEPESLSDALARSDQFVYFGHAEPLVNASLQPRLLLDEAGFKVSDILALRRVPRHVVLAGCSTGLANEGDLGVGGRTGDLGLAQAFLLRGSLWVLGTVRPVLAVVAADLLRALLEHEHLGEPGVDPATALHKARQWVSDHPDISRGLPAGERDRSLDAFRAFEP